MPGGELATFILLPIGLGLFGFIEPCAIGSTLLFIKTTEGTAAAAKVAQVVAFTLSRAVFTGLLGALAALIGSLFLGLQKAVWVMLGVMYAAIGILYLTGRIGPLMRSIGPRLATLSSTRGSIALGAALGLNIPACAGPLLLALLAASAAGGASGANLARGFVSLALFGFALSLPLVVAVLFAGARRLLDWLAGLTRRMPFWTGALFVVLGVWSIWFGLYVSIK
ncbi:MAG: cytochrome c biogenesis protein CcdA [Terriglobales bacterium]